MKRGTKLSLDTVSPQPPPKPGKDSITDEVINDLSKRREGGVKKYGMELETWNGRSMLVDAFQEILDAALYIRGAIMEENDVAGAVEDLEAALTGIRLLFPTCSSKWKLGEVEAQVRRAIRRLTPRPRPVPGTSSPSAS